MLRLLSDLFLDILVQTLSTLLLRLFDALEPCTWLTFTLSVCAT
ncbi:hypothetical protein PFLuk1_01046 [Pseudomonas fluorescens]|nr:hypothetical protein PFLuk1_01046 [Pseudomonas fluorescens]